jgi:L-threonylcarbamoyladenylate synthase
MSSVRAFQDDGAASSVDEAARVVRDGGVIAMPTDSFYALGACVFNESAVRRVCAIKGERGEKPILVLIADRSQLDGLASTIPPAATVLMDRFWPGPLTIVLPASPRLPHALTAGTGTVGVRLPAVPHLRKLLRITGPLTGTSANRSGASPARSAREVEQRLGEEVELILDGGPAIASLPSTVVETMDRVRVVREGQISRRTIQTVLAEQGMAVM